MTGLLKIILSEEEFAIHGDGHQLLTEDDGFTGALLISGLWQIKVYFLGVEVLIGYFNYKEVSY